MPRSVKSSMRMHEKRCAILAESRALYPSVSDALLLFTNNGHDYVNSVPRRSKVLGAQVGRERRVLLFAKSWRKLLQLVREPIL